VTDQQTTDATDPREGPHDGPAVAVASQPPPIFTRTRGAVGAIANNEDYPPSSEPLSHGVTLVAAVADRAVGIATRLPTSDARHPNPVQRRLDQRDFRRRGRGEMYFRRSTLAVEHHHPFQALAPFRLLNVGASSFALAKDPSMNVLSRRRRPRASTGPRKSRHTRSHVPSSSHARSRRQHVVPLGFPSDRLRHRAPVLSTQRIPATTSRCGTRGRPPRCERVSRGRGGSMVARCASVNRKLR
jgi:hypothetical protein